jgi:hypothetical protein
MAASRKSCRGCGRAMASVRDPDRKSAAQRFCHEETAEAGRHGPKNSIPYFTVMQSTGAGADLRDNGSNCERSHRLACQAGQSRRDDHA